MSAQRSESGRNASEPCFIGQLVESFRFEDAKLPSLPNAVIYLERAIGDDRVDLARLAELLETDPVLAARLIRVANSAFYRSVTPVESVPEAVMRIGLHATRNIALVLLGNAFTARHSLVAQRIADLWSESLRTAAIAAVLARHYPLVESHRAMLGGLLYNVGAMLLLTKIDENVRSIPHPLILDHMLQQHAPQFGVRLLQFWDMDPDLLEVVANRDNWQRSSAAPPDLADLILVSRCCSAMTDNADEEADEQTSPDFSACELLPSYQRISRFLNLPRPLCDVVTDADESIEELLKLLN